MNCGMSLVKYILFVFNLLCALAGIGIIILGALLISDIGGINNVGDQIEARVFPISVIVLGGLIFIIAFFGCCGAIRESQCMSLTYATLLFILLIIDVVLVVLLFTTTESQRDISEKIVKEAWKNCDVDSCGIHIIERKWQCCGKEGPWDYGITVNKACCKPGTDICTVAHAYKEGCIQKFGDWVQKQAKYIAYAAIGVIVVELVGFIFACCLANHIRNHRRRSSY